jgi:diadenosine tetraphosphatase ApaH/serine/threonine PP2A family protein phosphatase
VLPHTKTFEMKYAIISDVHANLEALTSVIDDARTRGVKHFLCLGDVVGYNANPCECIEVIRRLGGPVIMGNHDSYAVVAEIPSEVNGRARESMVWTRDQLNKEHHAWLSALKLMRRVGSFELVHSSMNDPEAWNYVTDAFEATLHFKMQETPLCFYGHTHRPMYFTTKERKTFKDFERIELEHGFKYYVNVGSVGQPRGDDKRAQYAIYDTEEKIVDLCRVEYDIATACKKIRAAGLPEHNALRLEISEIEATEILKQQAED